MVRMGLGAQAIGKQEERGAADPTGDSKVPSFLSCSLQDLQSGSWTGASMAVPNVSTYYQRNLQLHLWGESRDHKVALGEGSVPSLPGPRGGPLEPS